MTRDVAGGPVVGRRSVLAGATGTAALVGCAPARPVTGLPVGAAGAGPAVAPAVAVAGAGTGAAGEVVRVTVEVQKAALVEQLHAYFSDPSGTRNLRPVVKAVADPRGLGLTPALLEALVLEGDLSREDVDEFVSGMLASYENVNLVVS
jgi:hypothetical protein